MDWKKLAWSAVVSTGLVMGSACGDDDTTPDPDGGMTMTDGGGPMPMPLDCGDCFFVVNALDFGPGAEGRYPGFDVDDNDAGEFGDGEPNCGVPDYIGYDGSPGVDNGLGGLLGAASTALDVGAEIEAALAEGSIIILVEPSADIMSTEQTNVPLRIYLGETASGVAPMVDGMNRISADQVFNYFPEPDIMVTGNISGGILTAGPLDLPLSLDVMGTTLELLIEDAQIRVDVAQMTSFTGENTPHFLGGKIDLVALFEALGPLLEGVEVPISLLESILPLYLDLDPVASETVLTITPAGPGPDGMMGTADDTEAVTYTLEAGDCGSISAGIGLEFTTAMKGSEVSGS